MGIGNYIKHLSTQTEKKTCFLFSVKKEPAEGSLDQNKKKVANSSVSLPMGSLSNFSSLRVSLIESEFLITLGNF